MMKRMLASITSPSSRDRAACPSDVPKDLPPFFTEILVDLNKNIRALGGSRHFSGPPEIVTKVKREEFCREYTDYEYIYLTVLGLARVHAHCEEIISKNNGEVHTRNPGIQMLERVSGMTMHGDRDGANALVRMAPATLVEAFGIAKTRGDAGLDFFRTAFDRQADPCLEGRTDRLMAYIEARKPSESAGAGAGAPPWEDVSLRSLPPRTSAQDVIGEHLRVFINECTWTWSKTQGTSYEEAKTIRLDSEHSADFAQLYNAETFEAALVSRGLLVDDHVVQWEAATDSGRYNPYDEATSRLIEAARAKGVTKLSVRLGPKGWSYDIDLAALVQRNSKSGTERAIRRVEVPAARAGKLSRAEGRAAIARFVELATLPAGPTSDARSSSAGAAKRSLHI